jgi:ribonuclease T1
MPSIVQSFRRSFRLGLALYVTVLATLSLAVGCASSRGAAAAGGTTAPANSSSAGGASSSTGVSASAVASPSIVTIPGFKTVKRSALPAEARTTLSLIAKGGPFPFKQDGVVFQNREGILPKKAKGYYHEYTVKTPGSKDRGARRIVTGTKDEQFYTDDHYASFRQIVPG